LNKKRRIEESKEVKHIPPNLTNSFDRFDKMYWLEFGQKWGNYTFSSREKMEEIMVREIPRVAAWVNKNGTLELHKHSSNDEFTVIFKNTRFSFNYKDGEKVKNISWSKFTKEIKNLLPIYNDLCCNPGPQSKDDENCFNLWPGFKVKSIPKESVDEKLIQPILHHIRIVLANNDEVNYNYILAWLSHLVQKPWKKQKTALIFTQKKQQTGRGIFINWLIKSVLGPAVSRQIQSIKNLTERSNKWLVGKVLIFVDDLGSDEKICKSYSSIKIIIRAQILGR
jgi:hypothetical protein